MTYYQIQNGTSKTMGAVHDGEGVNFAVFSANADRIDLCLFSPNGQTEVQRLRLPDRTGDIWHGYVPRLPRGTLYGYRAYGSYEPHQGNRFNHHKLLIDPYTREFHGAFTVEPAVFGYDVKSSAHDTSFSTLDSAPFVPKSVVSHADIFEPALSPLPDAPTSELIYEAHAKGLTKLHPGVAEKLRGTYDGLASNAIIDHLHKLGVTTVELLPVQAFPDDGFLVEKGLRNYWGYNTIGFFAPEPRYFGPDGFIGFRRMVEKFHAADIRVIMDVVYNHTAEGDHRGPTLSFRGLDNASYYRLIDGQRRFYVNDAGTGNTLNMTNLHVLRMVTDSLRFWVTQMGVDGFRFDLMTTLGRESYGFDPNGGFLDALRQDPVLSKVRLIAEPWDLGPGGYQLGNFPYEFSELNDKFRDTVRRYWKGDEHSTQELSARLLGSADLFDKSGRKAWASLNYVSSHDGFTLADVCAYNEKHNEANGEDNRDGHSGNYSDNCGVEGETDDPVIRARRLQRQRNMLATMFLSQGTPMLLAGDEIGNSQGGNNNAYCQDNEIGWINWDKANPELVDFVAKLAAFRRDHCTVRQDRFLHGRRRKADGKSDVTWTDFKGQALEWRDPRLSNLCLIKRPSAEAVIHEDNKDLVAIAFNRSGRGSRVTLPDPPAGRSWVRSIDTAEPKAPPKIKKEHKAAPIKANSIVAWSLTPAEP